VPINLHPPLTAFPLALLVLVVALEIYSRCRGADWRKPIEFVLVLMVIAVVAAFFPAIKPAMARIGRSSFRMRRSLVTTPSDVFFCS